MATLATLATKLTLVDELTGGLDKTVSKLDSIGKKVGSIGKGMTAGITVPIVAIGAAALKVGADYDNALDAIQTKTGATGKELDALGQSTRDVWTSIPTDLNLAAEAIAVLDQRTEQTGDGLEALAATELELARITGEDLNAQLQSSTDVFNSWNVAAADQVKTLDAVFRASQETGVGTNMLLDQLAQYGPVLRSMGFDLDSSIALLAGLGKAGVDVGQVIAGLKIGIANLAQDGVTDLNAGLTDMFKQIELAGSASEATGLAIEFFGARAGPALADNIRTGKLSIEDLLAVVADGEGTILDTAAATNDWAEKWQILKNRALNALIPLGTTLFDTLNRLTPTFEKGTAFLTKLIEAFNRLPSSVKTGVLIFTALLAVLGPVLVVIGMMLPALSALAPVLGLLLGPVGLIIAALVLLGIAYKKNLFGFGDAVDKVSGKIGEFLHIFKMLYDFNRRLGKNPLEAAFAGVGGALSELLGLNLNKFFNVLARGFMRPLNAILKIGKGLAQFVSALIDGDWSKAFDGLRKAISGVGDLMASLPKLLGEALRNISTGFGPLDSVIHRIGGILVSLGRLVQEIFQGDFKGALEVAKRLLSQLGGLFKALGTLILAVFDAIPWGTLFDALLSAGQAAISALGGLLGDIASWVLNIGAPALGGWIVEQAGNLWNWIKETGAPGFFNLLGDIAEWSLNVAAPALGGWIAGLAGGIWGWIKGLLGLGGGGSVNPDGTGGPEPNGASISLGDWILDTIAPAVIGWIWDHRGDIWTAIKILAGWPLYVGIWNLGSWSLRVGAPALIGWLVDNKGTIWEAIKILAGWPLYVGIWELGKWTLNVGAPELLGWLVDNKGDIWTAIKILSGWVLVEATYDFIKWSLNVPVPKALGWMADNVGDLWSALKALVSGWSDSVDASIGVSLSGTFSAVGDWIGDAANAIAKAAGWVWDHGGSFLWHLVVTTDTEIKEGRPIDIGAELGQDEDFTYRLKNMGFPNASGNVWGSGDMYTGGSTAPQGIAATTYTIDVDTSAAETKINDLKGLFGGGSAGTGTWNIPTTVDIDRDQAATDLQALIDDLKTPAGDGTGGPGSIFSLPIGLKLEESTSKSLATELDATLQLASTIVTGIETAMSVQFAAVTAAISTAVQPIPSMVGQAFDQALQVSATVASAIYTVVSQYFGMMVGNVAGIVNTLPGTVTGAMNATASSGAAAAYNAGASVSYGFANGIWAGMSSVTAAVNALASEAIRAAQARLLIASPSRVFHDIGENVGEGFVQGIEAKFGDASIAGDRLAGAATGYGRIPTNGYGPSSARDERSNGTPNNHYGTENYYYDHDKEMWQTQGAVTRSRY